jgi:hypothetical protein
LLKTFIPDPLPERRYIPDPVKSDIRYRLYERGSNWDTVRAEIVRRDQEAIDKEIAERIVAPKLAKNETAAHAAMMDMKSRGKVLIGATLDDFKPNFSYVTPKLAPGLKLYAVDHDPSLAEHWVNGGGNRASDDNRRGAVEGRGSNSKLELVTVYFNSQKGSRDLSGEAHRFKKNAWISPPFKSEYAKDINNAADNEKAVTIDGYSLTYEDGTPFVPTN